jgi:hypothetical protein
MPTYETVPDCFGNSVFCDDIRLEVGSKISFIGTYRGTMYIQGGFPFVLPKFGLAARFAQRSDIYDPNLRVWIFLPGNDTDDAPSIEAKFPEGEAPTASLAAGAYFTSETHMIIAPFVLESPGAIRVRILRQDKLYKVGQLKVELAPAPPQPAS